MAFAPLTPGRLANLNTPRFGTPGLPGHGGTPVQPNGAAGGWGQGVVASPAHLITTPPYSVPGGSALTLVPFALGGMGGNGGFGLVGVPGAATPNGIGGFDYADAGQGGNGGKGGGSHTVSINLSDVHLGAASGLMSGVAQLGASGFGGNGGAGGFGGSGGNAGFDSAVTTTDIFGNVTETPTGTGGAAGNGGGGGQGGKGADATVQVDQVLGTLAGGGNWNFQAMAAGGTGGSGGMAGAGGSGGRGGAGGTGGRGGDGGNADASLTAFNLAVTSPGGLSMSVSAIGGIGGHGGDGGGAGMMVHTVSGLGTTSQYTIGGQGGTGGNGGDATANFISNTIAATAPLDLTISLMARGGYSNTGGMGGSGGSASTFGGDVTLSGVPGAPGFAGATGAPVLDMTSNIIDLAGGGTMHLALSAAAGTGPGASLSGAGGNLIFSRNSFTGNDWKLDLNRIAGGAATIDINAHTLQIAGSPANFLSGVTSIDGTYYADTFNDGAGNQTYGVFNGAGLESDTINFATGHGHDAITGAAFSGVHVNLHGFAGLASYEDVVAASSTGVDAVGGYTEIATPDGGSIRFEGMIGLQPSWFSYV